MQLNVKKKPEPGSPKINNWNMGKYETYFSIPVSFFGTSFLLFLTALLIMIAMNAFFTGEMKHGYFDYP